MKQSEKNKRNKDIICYMEANPMNATKAENIERLSRRYKISTVHIYRILKQQKYESN